MPGLDSDGTKDWIVCPAYRLGCRRGSVADVVDGSGLGEDDGVVVTHVEIVPVLMGNEMRDDGGGT